MAKTYRLDVDNVSIYEDTDDAWSVQVREDGFESYCDRSSANLPNYSQEKLSGMLYKFTYTGPDIFNGLETGGTVYKNGDTININDFISCYTVTTEPTIVSKTILLHPIDQTTGELDTNTNLYPMVKVKTINGETLLGEGNIEISGGAVIPVLDADPENPEEGQLWIVRG